MKAAKKTNHGKAYLAQLKSELTALRARVADVQVLVDAIEKHENVAEPPIVPTGDPLGVLKETTKTIKIARGSRRQAFVDFMRSHGPLKRVDIIEKSGIPKGTIATLLNDKTQFRRDAEGLWHLIERKGAKHEEG